MDCPAAVALPAAGLKRSEAELAALGSRLGRLEGCEASNPKASMRLVSALEDKMDSLAAQQVCAWQAQHITKQWLRACS
jgi:hypothetical protein